MILSCFLGGCGTIYYVKENPASDVEHSDIHRDSQAMAANVYRDVLVGR